MRKENKRLLQKLRMKRKTRRFLQKPKDLFGIGDAVDDPEAMSFPVVILLIGLSVALGMSFLASNLAALKIWNLFGTPVDAGIFLFPISYVAGDFLMEIYGQKISNLIAIYCSLFAVIIAGVLCFARWVLPDFPGVDNGAFVIVQEATGRIFLASVAGFLAGQLVNNDIFARIRHKGNIKDDASSYRERALKSSAIAHATDSLIFETIAFVGRLALADFLIQVLFAYCAGLIIEAVLNMLTYRKIEWLRWELNYTDGKNIDEFSDEFENQFLQ